MTLVGIRLEQKSMILLACTHLTLCVKVQFNQVWSNFRKSFWERLWFANMLWLLRKPFELIAVQGGTE